MAKQPGKTTIQIELTEVQRAQIRAATGREINRLELRIRAAPERDAGPEIEAQVQILARPGDRRENELARPPLEFSDRRSTPADSPRGDPEEGAEAAR